MAKDDHADQTLRAIAKEVLIFLMQKIERKKIHGILLTGSLANGEGTVVKHGSCIVTSDFDFVVYLDSQYFLKNKVLFQKMAHQMTTNLVNKGITTHVDFLPIDLNLRSAFTFMTLNIYEYEFSLASKCVLGNSPHFNKNIKPSRKDSLELAFTVASDLVFSELTSDSEIEQSYKYAKRALTLLNSLLIFQGIYAETYEKRIEFAKKHLTNGLPLLVKNELWLLQLFTEYKLHGSLENIMNSLRCTSLSALIKLEKEFLKKLTVKIIFYEIMCLTRGHRGQNFELNVVYEHISPKSFSHLLNEYLKKSKISVNSRIVGLLIYLFAFIRKDQERAELFRTFVSQGQPPKVILNYMVSIILFNGQNLSTPLLHKEFSWINMSGSALKKIFSLWKLAEQSIKL
ncbi:MAG: hypothetical protein NUK63_04520 [Candidatus Bathyarchaeum tardum]|nr:MAG: hypothetical protein NUK63_04520 [Candidatus Bathyarchaeum tardum]